MPRLLDFFAFEYCEYPEYSVLCIYCKHFFLDYSANDSERIRKD